MRTGVRLSEQAALTVRGHRPSRGWAAISGSGCRAQLRRTPRPDGSAPKALVRDLAASVGIDRAEVVTDARCASKYSGLRKPLVIEDSRHRVMRHPHRPLSPAHLNRSPIMFRAA